MRYVRSGNGAGSVLHRATSPFVAGKYVLNRTSRQYQFFVRKTGGVGAVEDSCLVQKNGGDQNGMAVHKLRGRMEKVERHPP
jgi:hypothetical protein